ncbi:sensor histidine kinase [Streptomyces varsoviensis]|uniref:histidine kinase n=1 Tax=Streptomyces varsoviensis TaxID=67373 RepID=A0ABR5IVA1_9ACTN|nr:HAMP domain-containing sensor histidine kinase [Streptomyces varsoviensis]KOG85078.1 histidine kinase [Streptomyces varsoviensis]
MRRGFGSVRARAALGATLVVAVALVAAGIAVLAVLRGNLTDQADLQAEADARGVASQIATGEPFKKLESEDHHPMQVVDDDKRVRAVSDHLEAVSGTGSKSVKAQPSPTQEAQGSQADDKDDDSDDGDDSDEAEGGPGPGRAKVSDDVDISTGTARVHGKTGDYRFAAVEARTPKGEKVTVYVGAPLATEQDAVATVRGAMLIGLPLLLLVVAGVTWLVTRRALRPVEGIRREMAAITASEDLARRVPEPRARDEVARLARTTNETLAALQASVERQRRFVADASHELRSPIASLRTQLEVGVAHPELLDAAGAVEDTVRLQNLAADLLLLARLDAGERPADGRVDLAGLAREETARRAAPARGGVAVRAAELAPGEVLGSRGQLGRVLGNLVDNACRHAESEVVVSVRAEGRWLVLAVADDGAGVPEPERERIFERFVRLDDARSRDDGGAGLGLAIARDVAARHGGTLTVRASPSGGACFELRLERAGSQA